MTVEFSEQNRRPLKPVIDDLKRTVEGLRAEGASPEVIRVAEQDLEAVIFAAVMIRLYRDTIDELMGEDATANQLREIYHRLHMIRHMAGTSIEGLDMLVKCIPAHAMQMPDKDVKH